MTSELDPTVSNRLSVICSIEIIPAKDFFLTEKSKGKLLEQGFSIEDACVVVRGVKTGLDEEDISYLICDNKEVADRFLKDNSIGTCISDQLISKSFSEWEHEFGNLSSIFVVGEDELFYPCYLALCDAGVKEHGSFNTRQEVFDSFTKEDLSTLKERYGENWSSAVEAQYVLNRFPPDSLAGYAARIFYNYFITNDGFSAGYLWREMKMVLSRVEEVAIKEKEVKLKAGMGGAKASSSRKARRLEAFVSEIESLAHLFPQMAEQRIVDQAFENAIAANESLWREGKDQKENYLALNIRSENPFKTRYYSIFGKTA